MQKYRLVSGDLGTGLRQIIKFEARNDGAAVKRFKGNAKGDWSELWNDGKLLAKRGDVPNERPSGSGWRSVAAE